jgi:hypothetical protein
MAKDKVYDLSTQIAQVCDGHDASEIIQAIGSVLSYFLQDEEPEDGVKMMMSMAMAVIETAYDITGEFLDASKMQ